MIPTAIATVIPTIIEDNIHFCFDVNENRFDTFFGNLSVLATSCNVSKSFIRFYFEIRNVVYIDSIGNNYNTIPVISTFIESTLIVN